MGLFVKRVKDLHAGPAGYENKGAKGAAQAEDAQDAKVKVLGGGCAKCNQLEAAAKEALQMLHMDESIGHVRDFSQIAAYGVMSTPALVVDGKVVSSGKVLKAGEIAELIKKVRE